MQLKREHATQSGTSVIEQRLLRTVKHPETSLFRHTVAFDSREKHSWDDEDDINYSLNEQQEYMENDHGVKAHRGNGEAAKNLVRDLRLLAMTVQAVPRRPLRIINVLQKEVVVESEHCDQ